MGYDAFVMCACYQRGLTTAPPTHERVTWEEGYLWLDVEELAAGDPARYNHLHDAFDTWQQTACPHPAMRLCDVRIANAWGMADFSWLVHERGGAASYPVLTAYLPKANGGYLPAQQATALLAELDALAAGPAEELAMLRRQPGNELLYGVNRQSGVVFRYSNPWRYGLNQAGFYITEADAATGAEVVRFRARQFSQTQLADKQFCFTDLATGTTYTTSDGLESTADNPAPDATFLISLETAPVASRYAYILTPLRQLAEAALTTGNSICWT